MNARHSLLRRVALVTLATLTVIGLTGCPGCEDSIVDPDPGIETVREMIVEDGLQPVWINDTTFVFNYATGGPDGIFMSDMVDSSITELYPGDHNHDYVVSPSGNWIAFSTPDLDGGVYLVELTDPPGEPVPLFEGGKRPSFIDDNLVVMENQTGDFGMVEIVAPGVFIAYAVGSFPRASGDGRYIAYLYSDPIPNGDFELRYYDRNTFSTELLVSGRIATDHTWNPVEDIVYVSQFGSNTFTDVMEIPISDPSAMSTLQAGATRPSVSLNGTHLFVDKVNGFTIDGIEYINLIYRDTRASIKNAQHPAAAPYGTRLLAEQSDSIYLITFE